MNNEQVALVLGVLGTVCWGICFWWMHSISRRQDAMLQELHEQTRRIERLSREEHDLIQEVHPKVEEISEDVGKIAQAVPERQPLKR